MNSDVLILFYVFYVQDDKLHLIAAIVAEQRRSEQNKPPLPRVATVRWQRLDPTLTHRAPPSQPPWCTSFNGWISFLLLYLDVWLQMEKKTQKKPQQLLYPYLSAQDSLRDKQNPPTSAESKCRIFHIWKIKLECRNGLIQAQKHYFETLVQMSARLFCTLRQTKI